MKHTHCSSDNDMEKLCNMEEFPEHRRLSDRFKKTLYYGYSLPKTDRPSLPLTEIAVELFQDASPKDLGQVDCLLASSMARKACMSPCSMMLGMIYIERLKNKNPEYVQKMSSADLFLISMMMASKYLYDEGTDDEVFNDEWAESASVELEDVNRQEKSYLSAIDWSLFVRPHEFWNKVHQVETRIAWEKGRERGWLTYTDISVLTEHPGYRDMVIALTSLLSKVVIVFSVAYAAAIGTILASTMATMALKERLPVQPITSPVSWWPNIEPASQLAIGQPQVLPNKQDQLDVLQDNETANELRIDGTLTTNKVESSTEEDVKKQQTFGIPGLITLALIQDTICQFIDGVKLKINQGYGATADGNVNLQGRCRKCKDCNDLTMMQHAPANSSSLLHSMMASELRCTCGRQNKLQQEKRRQPTHEELLGKLPGFEGNAGKLWNLVTRSLSSGVKHGRVDQGQGGDQETRETCCCPRAMTEEVLTLPISELVLNHGQTLPALSVLG